MSQPSNQSPKRSFQSRRFVKIALIGAGLAFLCGFFGVPITFNILNIFQAKTEGDKDNLTKSLILGSFLAAVVFALLPFVLPIFTKKELGRVQFGLAVSMAVLLLGAAIGLFVFNTNVTKNPIAITAAPTANATVVATTVAIPTTSVPTTIIPTTIVPTTIIPTSATATALPPPTSTQIPTPTYTSSPTPLPTTISAAPSTGVPSSTSAPQNVSNRLPMSGIWRGSFLEGNNRWKFRLELGQRNNGVEGRAFIEDLNNSAEVAELDVRGTFSEGTLKLTSIQLLSTTLNYRTCSYQEMTLTYKSNPVDSLDGGWTQFSCGGGTINVQRVVTAPLTLPPTATPGLVMMTGVWKGTFYEGTNRWNFRLELRQKNNDVEGKAFIEDSNNLSQVAQLDVRGTFSQGTLKLNSIGLVSSTLN